MNIEQVSVNGAQAVVKNPTDRDIATKWDNKVYLIKSKSAIRLDESITEELAYQVAQNIILHDHKYTRVSGGREFETSGGINLLDNPRGSNALLWGIIADVLVKENPVQVVSQTVQVQSFPLETVENDGFAGLNAPEPDPRYEEIVAEVRAMRWQDLVKAAKSAGVYDSTFKKGELEQSLTVYRYESEK